VGLADPLHAPWLLAQTRVKRAAVPGMAQLVVSGGSIHAGKEEQNTQHTTRDTHEASELRQAKNRTPKDEAALNGVVGAVIAICLSSRVPERGTPRPCHHG
jgi:hypothetical protein